MTHTPNTVAVHTERMVDPRVIDPGQEIVHHGDLGDAEIAQIVRVLSAIRRWRESEQHSSNESRSDMALNETDMKALRYLVVAKNQGEIVTPGTLAKHLEISSASTTKLLDRLAAAGHLTRSQHPTDRRALRVTITQQTHERVRDTIGKKHARRFEVVAGLSSADRETVIRFLTTLAGANDAAVGPDGAAAAPPDA